MQKLRFYTEQFMRDKESGAVSATQVQEQFPELVPTVAARIAQATGEQEAKQWALDQVQEVLQNDELRLNTANRKQFLDGIRKQAFERTGGQDFYGTGFLDQVDRTLNEFETTWMRETAQYHQELQKNSFSDAVVNTLKSGGDLLALDNEWKQSSSLNNVERNKIIVDSVIAQAIADSNPKMLDTVPTRFLNAESKAELAKVGQQIEAAKYSEFVRAKEIAEFQRSQSIRAGKASILQRLVSGDAVNPADYYKTPELYEYALRLNSQPTLDATYSTRNAASVRSKLLQAGTTGSFIQAFETDPEFLYDFRQDGEVTEDRLRDHIMARSDLNPNDKQKLMDDLPQLMGGVNMLRDQEVKTYFDAYVGFDLKNLATSELGKAVFPLKGINPEGEVRRAFYDVYALELSNYIEKNNQLPRGDAKTPLLEKAREAAERRILSLQNLLTAPQATNNPAPTPQRAAPEGSANTIRLPNGVEVRRVE
ncbi:hypothetical protein D7236_08320 [Stutzerimonas stutzeri]|nr:hypothetical protein [Stutzerimonas stutzeri]